MAVTLREYTVGFVVFASLLTGILTFSSGIFNTYGSTFDDSTLSEIRNLTKDKSVSALGEGRNRSQKIGSGSLIGGGGFFLNSVWQVIATVFDTLDLAWRLPGIISKQLPMPSWMTGLIFSVIVAIVIFEVVSLYRGLRT